MTDFIIFYTVILFVIWTNVSEFASFFLQFKKFVVLTANIMEMSINEYQMILKEKNRW